MWLLHTGGQNGMNRQTINKQNKTSFKCVIVGSDASYSDALLFRACQMHLPVLLEQNIRVLHMLLHPMLKRTLWSLWSTIFLLSIRLSLIIECSYCHEVFLEWNVVISNIAPPFVLRSKSAKTKFYEWNYSRFMFVLKSYYRDGGEPHHLADITWKSRGQSFVNAASLCWESNFCSNWLQDIDESLLLWTCSSRSEWTFFLSGAAHIREKLATAFGSSMLWSPVAVYSTVPSTLMTKCALFHQDLPGTPDGQYNPGSLFCQVFLGLDLPG